MRCLYCSKKLSMFQRLTEGDFCSAQHRKLYETEQQEIMAARIGQSREQQWGETTRLTETIRRRLVAPDAKTGRLAPAAPYSVASADQTLEPAFTELETVAFSPPTPSFEHLALQPQPQRSATSPAVLSASSETFAPLPAAHLQGLEYDAPQQLSGLLEALRSEYGANDVSPQNTESPEPGLGPGPMLVEHVDSGAWPTAYSQFASDPLANWATPSVSDSFFGLPAVSSTPVTVFVEPEVWQDTAFHAAPVAASTAPGASTEASDPTPASAGMTPSPGPQPAMGEVRHRSLSMPPVADLLLQVPAREQSAQSLLLLEPPSSDRLQSLAPQWAPVAGTLALAALSLEPLAYDSATVLPAIVTGDGPRFDSLSKKIYRIHMVKPVKMDRLMQPVQVFEFPDVPPQWQRLSLRPEPVRPAGAPLLERLRAVRLPVSQWADRWQSLQRVWAAAPADLRWVALIVPVLIALVVGFSLYDRFPKSTEPAVAEIPAAGAEMATTGEVAIAESKSQKLAKAVPLPPPTPLASPKKSAGPEPKQAEAATPAELPQPDSWQDDLKVRWSRLVQRISDRAAVAYVDDFRTGLSGWTGPGDWARSWSYDNLGFIRPGTIAVYEPSMNLNNYRMEFLTLVERGSVGWVYRVVDWRNYYASRLIVSGEGVLSQLAIEHYAVVNGRVQKQETRVLPATLRPESFYRVRLEAMNDTFAIYLQGNLVDSWSDKRFASGGVGFFGAKGSGARIRWLEVSHQYDVIGRVCASLLVAGMGSRSGS